MDRLNPRVRRGAEIPSDYLIVVYRSGFECNKTTTGNLKLSRVAQENSQPLALINWVTLHCRRLHTISRKVLTLLGSLGSANNLAENDRRGELKPPAKIWPFSEHYFDFQSFVSSALLENLRKFMEEGILINKIWILTSIALWGVAVIPMLILTTARS